MRHLPLTLLLLLSLLQASACVETPYTEPPEVLYPGPCSTEERTFLYDERHRISEVRDASGEVLERYTYRTDHDFDVEFQREIGYDPLNSLESLDSVVLLNAKLTAHVQIHPDTFEMRVSSIEATLPPPYEQGSGTVEYTYEESSDGWLTSMTATVPTGWRFLDQAASSWGYYQEDRPSRNTDFYVEWVDASWYEEWSGESVDRDKVLSIAYENGAASQTCYYGDKYIHRDPLEVTTLQASFKTGEFGIEKSMTNNIENTYDSIGNMLYSAEKETKNKYTYSCWTNDDKCSRWRYVHSDSNSTFAPLSREKRVIWFNLFEVVRIPCEWSWMIAARLP